MNRVLSSLRLNRLLPDLRRLAAVSLVLLSGCKTHLEPASYSPDYQGLTRADGRVELIPVECLKPSPEDQFGTDEDEYVPLLPPGCANNLTLLQMVEQRSDLMQGRATGPTMAAPVGRAAQVYIDGYDREELRRRQSEQQGKVDKQEAQ
jgi:type IV pilus biogenesis protein CpaD/CtpE